MAFLDEAGLAALWRDVETLVGDTEVADGSITTAKIANGAVTDDKLAQEGGVLSLVGKTLLKGSHEYSTGGQNWFTSVPALANVGSYLAKIVSSETSVRFEIQYAKSPSGYNTQTIPADGKFHEYTISSDALGAAKLIVTKRGDSACTADVTIVNNDDNLVTYIYESESAFSEFAAKEDVYDSLVVEKQVEFTHVGYIDTSGIVVSVTNWRYSDKIKVSAINKTVSLFFHTRVAALAFYDDNETYIGCYQKGGANAFATVTVTVPDGAVYAVYSTQTNYENDAKYYDSVSSERIGELDASIQQLSNKLSSYNLDNGRLLKYAELPESDYGLMGRWYKHNGKDTTNNQGSEIYCKVNGCSVLTVDIRELSTQAVTPRIAYSIDNSAFVRQVISTTTIAIPSTDEHIVRIVIDGMTEAQGGSKWSGTLGVYINEISVNAGTIVGLRPLNRIGIFYGDSVTEGINSLGTGATAENNSSVETYAYYCCQYLNAVSYRVGYGGTGLLRTSSFRPCIEAIDHYTVNDLQPSFVADFIVINHGINDYNGGYSTEEYIAAYRNVISRLRIKYSSTPIFCVSHFKENQPYAAAMQVMCEDYSNTYFISSAGWLGATTDGTHLSHNGAVHNGGLLATEILKVLGAGFFE